MVLQEPPVLERVDGDWQQDDDAEEGDPAQGALQVGLFYLLALEAEMGPGWEEGVARAFGSRGCGGPEAPGPGELVRWSLGMVKGRTSGKGSPE